jgi:hypothetical protein
MNTITKTLTLATFRLEKLDTVLAKLGKKAKKLECLPPSYKVIREYVEDVSESDVPHLVSFSEIELTYSIITVVGDWKFIASIETVDSVDGVPRNRVSGPNLSEDHAKRYITAPQVCEHCGHNRKRNLTYIVQNYLDETKQIGSTCLREYMGVDPSIAVDGIKFASLIEDIGSDGDAWGFSGSRAPACWKLEDVSAIALSLIAKNGFVKAADAQYGNARKTGDDMLTYLIGGQPALRDWYSEVKPSDENIAAAKSIVERLNARILPDYRSNPTALDSFSFKLGTILNRKAADAKDLQLFASCVNREAGMMAKENAKTEVKNEWLPGACEGSKVSVDATIAFVKEVFSTFGTSLLIKFVTSDGFPISTFYSGRNQEFNAGSKVKVSGTVKKLEDGKFGKCVMLTRVKVVA